jgi:Iron-containing redox enzyme
MSISLGAPDPHIFQLELARFNQARLAVGIPPGDAAQWQNDLHLELAMRLAEGHYLEGLRTEISPYLPAADLLADSADFANWFESLQETGPGQQHGLFDWLAQQANMLQMRWFLTQEAAGEAGFEDLVALAQIKLPVQAKLECARNFWDEMGHGRASAMHGPMLERMVSELDLQPKLESTVWESLALANTMIGLASTRRYAYHAIGALGVIELTAPERVTKISAGMRRLGMEGRVCAYYDLHGALDVSHARAWISEVIRPLVQADPNCAQYIAEGALMRLRCGEKCYQRYDELLRRTDAQISAQTLNTPARPWLPVAQLMTVGRSAPTSSARLPC